MSLPRPRRLALSSSLAPHLLRLPAALTLIVMLTACGSTGATKGTPASAAADGAPADGSSTDASDAGATDIAAAADVAACTPKDRTKTPKTLGGSRAAKVYLPTSWDGCTQLPLVLLLHGYGATGTIQNFYLGLSAAVDDHKFVLVVPEGTTNSQSKQFWNATAECCDFEKTGVDDVSYLRGLITSATASLAVDPARVYLIGHSNGGFMAHRMACEAADLVTGVASLAGAVAKDAALCKPSRAVNVLQMHGTNDATIPFEGSQTYASVADTMARWVKLNSCTATPTDATSADYDNAVDGKETAKTVRGSCAEGVEVALWEMAGSGHIPGLNKAFKAALITTVLSWRRTASR